MPLLIHLLHHLVKHVFIEGARELWKVLFKKKEEKPPEEEPYDEDVTPIDNPHRKRKEKKR